MRCAHGPTKWLTPAIPSDTSSASMPSGFSSAHTGMPPAVMTISSLSPLSRLSTWMAAISRAIGRDQGHHGGDGQRRHGQEAQRILALRGHQLELAQGDGDPRHARQGHEDEQQAHQPSAERRIG